MLGQRNGDTSTSKAGRWCTEKFDGYRLQADKSIQHFIFVVARSNSVKRKCLKTISFLHKTLTLSPGYNSTTSNYMDIKFVDVRWWLFWHVTSVFQRFVRSGVHVTKSLGALLKQNRKFSQLD